MPSIKSKVEPEFWRNKKVFITGHTGFKGTWLSLWLHSLGAEVTGYALEPPSEPNLYNSCSMNQLISSYINDVRDLKSLASAIMQTSPDIVFHLAAQPLVRESYKDPVATYETNMMGTVHVLEAVRTAVLSGSPVRAVINVTSDKCYENKEWIWSYREIDRLGGSDPYSGSKAAAEIITDSYRQAFFYPGSPAGTVAVASARAGNVIGGGDWSRDRLVPDSIAAFLQNKPVHIRNPKAVRPWQHVLEPLSGYLLLAQRLWESGSGSAYARGWNFGPDENDAVPVEELVSRLCAIWGEGASCVVEEDAAHVHEAHYLRLDSSLSRHELGWAPRWDLQTALHRTVNWAKAFQLQQDMREVCLQDIQAYMKGGPSA
ncbi:CDP-glucose 4,6-dehydratase [Paenibacillus pinistramenti]|uniref:CDP-glucose 4,6-dehydratase n=1 Tax=Paenibacillus pinistramenti TaxID=1768003 RepID=UPI00110966D1|nr:CDP-glucose 4,6-dehydratase [Paenibacillus pinistramenti]